MIALNEKESKFKFDRRIFFKLFSSNVANEMEKGKIFFYYTIDDSYDFPMRSIRESDEFRIRQKQLESRKVVKSLHRLVTRYGIPELFDCEFYIACETIFEANFESFFYYEVYSNACGEKSKTWDRKK